MRHRKAGKKLGRTSSHRRAMLRNMVTSLLKYEQIVTTDAKAKQIRPVAEKMITLAKRGDLHARRLALGYIKDKATTHKLFGELKDRFMDRQGGYSRIVKKGIRKGDAAGISVIQLLESEPGKKKRKEKKKEKAVEKTEKKAAETKEDKKVIEKVDEIEDSKEKSEGEEVSDTETDSSDK